MKEKTMKRSALVKWAARLLEYSWQAAWFLLIILLPITSFPLLQRTSGADMVSPAAAIPLMWLVLIWLMPFVIKRGKLPRQIMPLLGFLFVAIISSIAAQMTNIPPLKGTNVSSHELQQLVTLLIGIAFYLVISSWPRTENRLRLTLQTLNLTGLVLIAWSLLQTFFWYHQHGFPSFMVRLQASISINGFFDYRTTGLAFEPSWLAHQLNMAFLPFWLSATVQRTSIFRFRIFKLTCENFLLAGGVIVLYLSFSRVGWLAFLLTVAFLMIRGTLWLVRRLQQVIMSRFVKLDRFRWLVKSGLWVVILVTFVGVFVGGVVGLAYAGSKIDKRLTHLFQLPDPTQVTNFLEYANYLGFAERVVFWDTGWSIFNDHPILGVGIGNAGYYFPTNMPGFGWALTEVDTLFNYNTSLPNTKSMWTRLIAETGIIGFAFFICWLFVLWQSGRYLQKSTIAIYRTIGLAGILAMVAFLIEGFSIDSFALPYLWFSTGLVTAAGSALQIQCGRYDHGDPA
jgi:hypothetical protein